MPFLSWEVQVLSGCAALSAFPVSLLAPSLAPLALEVDTISFSTSVFFIHLSNYTVTLIAAPNATGWISYKWTHSGVAGRQKVEVVASWRKLKQVSYFCKVMVEICHSQKRIRDACSLWVIQKQSKQPNKNYTNAFFSQFLWLIYCYRYSSGGQKCSTIACNSHRSLNSCTWWSEYW